ncbi:hypothetical protein OG440_01485 [Streptomyces sp. NBC_00637]|uniref:hypothetical protein n=1 Tax=Streptomyces sp. NBC_00637 TaxID=2903667 RepID=UPI003250FCF4
MGDVLSSGPDRPPWRPPRRLIAAATAVALSAALVIAIVAVNGSDERTPAAPAASPSASPTGSAFPAGPDAAVGAGQTPGMVITGLALPRGATLVRRDRTANAGPSTVVVRRSDGSLGRHGAVVTFPVPAPTGGRPVQVGRTSATAQDREITWPVGGSYARVRGDLPQAELIAVAAATRVVSGRPDVAAPPGLSVTATGRSRALSVHETRYSSAATGEADELSGGLTFTGVARCGGLEDQMYAAGVQPAGTVDGKPAVITSVFGGNGALAWEPVPGVVAYIGYSGAQLDQGAVAALHRLAARTRLLSPGQWQATSPATSDQIDDFDRLG